ncbi:MAG: GAF domain-containing protein [Dissulfuribacterales bacterium]
MEKKGYEYFSAFVSVSKAISSSLKLQEVLDLIVKNAVESLDLKGGAASLLNKKEKRLELIAHYNLSKQFLNKGPILIDKSIPLAISAKGPVVVPDIKYDKELQYPEACKKEGIGAILSVPIIFREEIIGVLRLYDAKPREFGYREVEFISALAELGGMAIENARFMEETLKDHKKEVKDLWEWFQAMSGTGILDG